MITVVRLCFLSSIAMTLIVAPVHSDHVASTGLALPLENGFVENRGQLDAKVRFYSTSSRAAVYFTDQGPVLELRQFVPSDENSQGLTTRRPDRKRERRQPGSTLRFAVAIRFAGAVGPARIEALGDAVASHRYVLGTGARSGETAAAAFERVAYRNVWPGIDIVYSAGAKGLEYEIVATSAADMSKVGFEYEGATSVETSDGKRRISTPLGNIDDLHGSERSPGGRLEWSPASIDPARQDPGARAAGVIQDPMSILAGAEDSWGAFLGGARDEAVYAVAVDDQGRIFVTGATTSADFPTTPGVVDSSYAASFDVFVSQLSNDGTTLLWSTYVGGTGDDRGWAIALDSIGRPVVAGVTSSADFPTTPGVYDETPNGAYDAFVLKLAADGSSLVWSTLYGGTDTEWDVSGLDVDPFDRPVLSGSTRSADLPTTPTTVTSMLVGETDAFVARFVADGSALDYGTYLGGTGWDEAEDVVTTTAGGTIVIGRTDSADFPVTAGVFQPTPNSGSKDGFATGISPDGASLSFSTYLGGTGSDDPYAVVLDDLGRPVIAGRTTSVDFPTTVGAYAPSPFGGDDAFVAKIEADASALLWGTYFGGSSSERALDIVRDGISGFAFAGWSCSEDLPLTPNAFSSDYMGPCEGFVARLSQDGTSLTYSSYLGGWRDDSAFGLAVDPLDRLIVAGETWSTNFPVTPTSFAPIHNSPNTAEDGFVMTIGTSAICTSITLAAGVPELMLGKAPGGVCPDGPPLTSLVDLVEGRLESLAATTIGPVTPITCYSSGALRRTVSIPDSGEALFQLARLSGGGSYDDGAGEGLSGSRQPASGDCP